MAENISTPAVASGASVSPSSSGVGSGILGTVIGAGLSLYQNWRNRKFAEEQADKQYERTKELRDYDNAYNSPASQVARLKAAGLSPALMYGNGSAATGVSSSGAAQMGNAVPGNDLANAANSGWNAGLALASQKDVFKTSLKQRQQITAQNAKTWQEVSKLQIDNNVLRETERALITLQNNNASISTMLKSIRASEVDSAAVAAYLDKCKKDAVESLGGEDWIKKVEKMDYDTKVQTLSNLVDLGVQYSYQATQAKASAGLFYKEDGSPRDATSVLLWVGLVADMLGLSGDGTLATAAKTFLKKK